MEGVGVRGKKDSEWMVKEEITVTWLHNVGYCQQLLYPP